MKKDVLQILYDLVNIPSHGCIDTNHPIINYLKTSFKDCADIVEVKSKNGNTHLLIGINSKLRDVNNGILLSGHIDTVAPSEGHNAISNIEGNNLTGIGSSDMKSFIATIISKLDVLKNMEQPVLIAITSDEETNLQGINELTKQMQVRNINCDFVIVGEPTDSKFSISNRGNSIFVSEMHGVPCHSGTPELGLNAITLEMKFINELERITNEYMDRASICVTSVKGGNVPSNIVPEFCSACFSIRTSDLEVLSTISKELELIHQEISLGTPESRLFNVFSIPPFEKRASKYIMQQSNNKNIEIIEPQFATEAGYIQSIYPEADIVIFGPGNPECIHKAGEHININKLYNFEKELVDLLENYYVFDRSNANEKAVFFY